MISGRAAGIRHRRAKGFTLVELLVVMTLFGLISLALVGGLRFGTRAWEAGAARGEALSQIEIVQGVIRRQLGEVVPPELEGAETSESTAFTGTADSLEFFTYFPGHRGVGGRNYFRLAILPDDELMRLDLSWRLYRADGSLYENPEAEDDGESGEERRLIVGIESADFRYFGATDRDREPDWHDRWNLEEELPELVALTIAFPPGDRRYWPELIVATRLATQRTR
jgi:general secretion pathway protein J